MLQASGTIAGRLMAGARLSLFSRKTALVPSRERNIAVRMSLGA